MGLPEVGAADVIDTEVTGATVIVGAPAEGMIEMVGNIVIAPIGDSVVDVIGAGLGSGASSIGAGLGSGASSIGAGLGSGASSIGAGLGSGASSIGAGLGAGES
jgi:hypothetical protein